MSLRAAHFILYVRDQRASAAFYTAVLGQAPHLDVPGMTELEIGPNVVLGLMPEDGIRRLLGDVLPDPALARVAPRAEVYLVVDDPRTYHARAISARPRSARSRRGTGATTLRTAWIRTDTSSRSPPRREPGATQRPAYRRKGCVRVASEAALAARAVDYTPPPMTRRPRLRAMRWGLGAMTLLAGLIVLGSRNLAHFDAALVGYTFATLFATFGITYRYAMWLERPPTRMYWRRGWQAFLAPRSFGRNLGVGVRRAVVEVAANRFIFRRGLLRGAAHWLIMWGCVVAAAITFPLAWGWIHFETAPGDVERYRTFLFGVPAGDFPVRSILAFVVFHGLVSASFFVIAGVMIAFRRRMIDRGAAAAQQFGEDILPLVLLLGISVTGLMLTVSYTWMKGYAYSFLAILHAVIVIVTLLWLPFGKLFHVFQRPAQLGVGFYKDAAARGEQARCRRCERPYAGTAMVRDLTTVVGELGFRYELGGRAEHYQQICPRCRRALFGLAQAATWTAPAAAGPED